MEHTTTNTGEPLLEANNNAPQPPLPPPPPPQPPLQQQPALMPQQQQSLQHPQQQQQPQIQLPPGWYIASTKEDGQLYYYEQSTGRTSWVHPSLMMANNMAGGTSFEYQSPHPCHPNHQELGIRPDYNYYDTPYNATKRPKNYQMYCVCSVILFAPFGIIAMYHSLQVDVAWKQSRFGDSYNHSRQAKQYSGFANFLGLILWTYILLFRKESRLVDWKWPEFEGGGGGGAGGGGGGYRL